MENLQTILKTNNLNFNSIKAIVTDIDGVLTDGGIIYDDNGLESKRFNSKDGQIIKPLKDSGIIVGVITGRNSEVVRLRCDELKFDFHYHGISDKMSCLLVILEKYKLSLDEIAYIGDDLGDLKLIEKCGIGACPDDAPEYIKDYSDVITMKKGGEGCFREFSDLILRAQDKMDAVIEKFRL